ncbi:hypothetical protein [Dysgonomonas sp. 25]|uniref:hypothetical protein n=1 Tax=Dysgonomonas sp. 25 TaxID=2302933 RepID=UPI0013D74E06|nr:hypothetical protein [Dysgonomonas sp. 25]NDV68782.1 hypothetical protein [Dysgonomonas sp. 25]
MKYISALILLSGLLLFSCQDKKPASAGQLADDETILKLNDSITAIFKDFQANKDTASMLHALELSDMVLSLDRTEEGQYFGTIRKSQLLTALGKKKEAFTLQDKTTNQDPESIDRLLYNGVSAKLKNDETLANSYFDKAIQKCNAELAMDGEKGEYFITKISIYLYQNKKDEAEKEITKRMNQYPPEHQQHQTLVTLKENLDDMYTQTQDFFKN